MDKQLIKQILLEQKEEIPSLGSQKLIPRDIQLETDRIVESKLVKVIMGIRRCGKSTLSHQLLSTRKYGYINFDDERLVGVKSEDLNDFLEVLNEIEPNLAYLLIDEIQNVAGWELFINRLKRKNYNMIITGSNSKLLSKELSTHLVGRYIGLELYPFSFSEFLTFRGLKVNPDDLLITEKKAFVKKLFEEYFHSGGMPEVIDFPKRAEYLRELFDKIITRDIVTRYSIKYVKDLKEMALYLVSNCACKITYNKIKNIFEIKSVHTIKNHLEYLENAWLIFQIQPFSFKLKEQIKKPRKIYCIDNGFVFSLVSKSTPEHGKLLENLVFLHLKRSGKEIYYYSKPDYEIDFLIKEGTKIVQLIQVSFSISNSDTKKRELKSLLKASEELKCDNLIIITQDEEGTEKIKNKAIKIIPVWKWLLKV